MSDGKMVNKTSGDKQASERERRPLSRCYARQENDEMHCGACGIRWGIDEEKPEAARCRNR